MAKSYFKKITGNAQESNITDDDSTEKRTYPELLYKLAIVQVFLAMLDSEEDLRNNYLRVGAYKHRDVIAFKSKLVKLFSMTKRMIRNSDKLKKEHEYLYERLVKLEFFDENFTVKELIVLKNFLVYYLDELNLINLLMKGGLSWLEKIDAEY